MAATWLAMEFNKGKNIHSGRKLQKILLQPHEEISARLTATRAGVAEWQTRWTQNPVPQGSEGSTPSSGTF